MGVPGGWGKVQDPTIPAFSNGDTAFLKLVSYKNYPVTLDVRKIGRTSPSKEMLWFD
jgi:hypothetical protein